MAAPASVNIHQNTAFERAFSNYVSSLPEKKRKRKFIANCYAQSTKLTPESIQSLISDAEEKSSQKTSKRVVRMIVRPVVDALKAYESVIAALSNADPMPSALIWGALRVIIDGCDRFSGLFETIKDQLQTLNFELQRIACFDDLYGESDILQDLLFRSYITMLKFWNRVDKEIERSWVNTMFRSAVPFSTIKLAKIIEEMQTDASRIEKIADMVEKGQSFEARAASLEEYAAAELERKAAAEWRETQQFDRAMHQDERRRGRCKEVYSWLCSPEQSGASRHLMNMNQCLKGTCEWIISTDQYKAWVKGSTSPILFVTGKPGSGKSTLCSRTIDHISRCEPDGAVAFHFYAFDQQYSPLETLRLLGCQLFQAYWRNHEEVPEALLKYTTTTSALENVQAFIESLLDQMPLVYIFIDGLDEEREHSRWEKALQTLKFLTKSCLDRPSKVKMWCSSQIYACIEEQFEAYPRLDLQVRDDADLNLYFLKALSSDANDLEMEEEEKSKMLFELKDRSQGNFLWASLMIKDLKACVNRASMKALIEEGLPISLDDQYHKLFQKTSNEQRGLVGQIFSLVVFARRPLRFVELQDALWILQNKGLDTLDIENKPRASSIRQHFAPLIQEDVSQPDRFCRLVHSTVSTFLRKHPNVLGGPDITTELCITPYPIADACLLYLGLMRYAKPLCCKDGVRSDADGNHVEDQHFLPYSAKYWDKHLNMEGLKSKELSNRIQIFLDSPNFVTCLQCQSLWVQNHFNIHIVKEQPRTNTYLKRFLPAWFEGSWKRSGGDYWKDYRTFVHQWGDYLKCGTCSNYECPALTNAGEMDRIFWCTLGRGNFLSQYPDRYQSHLIEATGRETLHNAKRCFEGLTPAGDHLAVIQMHSRSNTRLELSCFTWACPPNNKPRFQRQSTISVDVKESNWTLYARDSQFEDATRVGRASSIAFDSTCSLLRVGSQLLSLNPEGSYETFSTEALPNYFEDFAIRNNVLVISSRRRVIQPKWYRSGLTDGHIERAGTDLSQLEGLPGTFPPEDKPKVKNRDKDSDRDSENEVASGSSNSSDTEYMSESSEEETDDSLAESWSEGSTNLDGTEFLEDDDAVNLWMGAETSDEDESTSDKESSGSDKDGSDDERSEKNRRSYNRRLDESDDEGEISFGSAGDDSTEDSDAERSDADIGGALSDDDSNERGFDSDCEKADNHIRERRRMNLKVDKKVAKTPESLTKAEASLSVFNNVDGSLSKLFTWTRPLEVFLYDSPPVIHPSKSLVVWPLNHGDVLFVDYAEKTWFTRRLRPSTSHTRHVFMKCHFSPCGVWLHIAALEAEEKRAKKQSRSKKDKQSPTKPTLRISLLLSTYRLSSSKPTRTPPKLAYRVKVHLGEVESLSVTNLPFTLTWEPEELFISCSSVRLAVFRMKLFHTKDGSDEDTVLVPRKPIFLPSTARHRPVYFFPATEHGGRHRVIIGSERPIQKSKGTPEAMKKISGQVIGLGGVLSPPVGFFLRDEEDLGGWGQSLDVAVIPEDRGIGRLDRRIEKFDAEDDCDLEAYIM